MTRSPRSSDLALTELAGLYEREFSRFVRVAAAITGDAESGRDVVQDAFASLVRHRRTRRRDASLAGWAWSTVVNQARSQQRTRRCNDEALARARAYPGPPDTTEAAPSGSDDTLAALRDLPERQRLIVFLRYYAGLDYAEIGEALDIRCGTVGAALNAAHAPVRARLR